MSELSPFPIRFAWDGEAMRPATKYWAREADKRYVVGETYTMDEIFVRSHATHAHYFAVIKAAWDSLTDEQREQFPSTEHLRKYALISTGYNKQAQYVCKSKREARRLVAALKHEQDEYAIYSVDARVVTVFRPQSQDHRSMDKSKFQESKEAVLRWIGDLIGADPTELRNAA